METPQSRARLEAQYREFVRRDLLPGAVRAGALLFFVISTVFIFVDRWLHPSLFWEFLPARIAVNVALAVVWFRPYRTHPLMSAVVTCLAGGLMLLGVIYRTGGASSNYYVGLVLLLMGIGVVAPLSSREALLVIGGLFSAQAGLSIFQVGGVDRESGLQLAYLFAAMLIGIMSCALLDRMRFTDFCQRRELEEARDALRELDQAKSRFTANVHHELRTPLTLMLAPLETIRAGALGAVPAQVDRMLRTMQSNGQRLLKLINDLLDLAKIESEQLEVRRVRLDLGALAGRVMEGAQAMADRKGLSLEAHGLDALPVIYADPDALEKVLVNLLGNALKFTETGRITLSGWVEPEGGVHLEVCDTGIGIPSDQVDKVFDRFAQVDGSATRRHEGTGIGLSLVQELVELHEGRVWAESEGLGHGARIHVVLPVGAADAGDEPPEEVLIHETDGRTLTAAASFEVLASDGAGDVERPVDGRYAEMERAAARFESDRGAMAASELRQHPPGTPEVVIAEDNGEMRRLLSFLIGQEFAVRPTANGREALDAVQERRPQLVVTDVMMPEMSGTELCRAVKSDPATRNVPVMLVTSKAESEMKIEGLELGADDYVTKPFHPRELMARVRSLVRLRVLQQEIAEQNASLERSNAQLAKALQDLKEAEVQIVQSERLAAVGELAAGVAHEVNNPLNFARNAVATLRADVEELEVTARRIAGLNLEGAELLGAARSAAERAKAEAHLEEISGEVSELMGILSDGLDRTARLVSDLRDFAAPHRGKHAAVDVVAGLNSTLQLLAHRLRAAGARVELAIPPALPPVEGDAGALNQVFLNLLKNAAEAIEGEKGTIHVSAWEEAGEVRVQVRDDGPGMSTAVRERLFDPFFTTKAMGQGTGLGLSMCRRILDQHGGAIQVDSEPGEGTCITLRLPLEPAELQT